MKVSYITHHSLLICWFDGHTQENFGSPLKMAEVWSFWVLECLKTRTSFHFNSTLPLSPRPTLLLTPADLTSPCE